MCSAAAQVGLAPKSRRARAYSPVASVNHTSRLCTQRRASRARARRSPVQASAEPSRCVFFSYRSVAALGSAKLPSRPHIVHFLVSRGFTREDYSTSRRVVLCLQRPPHDTSHPAVPQPAGSLDEYILGSSYKPIVWATAGHSCVELASIATYPTNPNTFALNNTGAAADITRLRASGGHNFPCHLQFPPRQPAPPAMLVFVRNVTASASPTSTSTASWSHSHGFADVPAFVSGGLPRSSGIWPQLGYDAQRTGRSPLLATTSTAVQWTFEAESDTVNTPAVGPDGTVYVSTQGTDTLYALDGATGAVVWSASLEVSVWSPVYSGASGGTVYVTTLTEILAYSAIRGPSSPRILPTARYPHPRASRTTHCT